MHSIRQVAQVFPEKLAKEVESFVLNAPYKYGWPSNNKIGYSHWNYTIAPGDALNGLEIAHKLPPVMAEAWNYIQQNYIGEQTLIRCYTNAHTYGVEGYPHTDSNREHDQTIVVYMNKEWKREWGGETMIYNGYDIVHAELPKFNKGLIFKGNQFHTAKSVSRICPELRMTLMFKFAPKNIDFQRDKIQVLLLALGADKIKHSKNHLLGHLLRTYDALREAGEDTITASAGGLHSIFGTNIFTKQTLTVNHRDIVVKVIGEEATELVELFRDIKRPETLEDCLKNGTTSVVLNSGGTKVLNQNQINKLCAIEAANLKDQDCLNKYPHLSRVLKRK